MKHIIPISLLTLATLAIGQSMRVYTKSGANTSYALVSIDSITFDPTTPPTNGLVSYFPFNGNALDESGYGNNGVVTGSTLSTDRFGIQNRAYTFNGTSNKIQSPFAGIAGTGPRTISIWIKTTVPGDYAGNQKAFYSYGIGPSGGMFGGELSTDNTNARTIEAEGNNTIMPFYANPADGNWHCVTLIVPNIAGPTFANVKIYLDTTLLTQQGSPYNPGTAVNTVLGTSSYIGANESGTASFFNGQLDDVRVYNRELTDTEVKMIARDKP